MGQQLTESLRETLAVFESSTPLTTREVADRLDLGRRSTYDRLDRLESQERIETKKVGASARVWWRPVQRASGSTESIDASAAAESLVEDFLDDTEVGVFILDAQGRVAWVNETAEEYFGLDRTTVIGQDRARLVEERIASVVANPAQFVETLLETYEGDAGVRNFECRVTSGAGRAERFLDHHSEPIESGALAGGRVELYYDVTDYRHSEQARKTDREEFESLIAAVEEYAIFLLDTEGYVRTWNAGAERVKGYDREEIVGEHFSTFYTEDDREAGVPEQNLERAAAAGEYEEEGWRVRADGTKFWADVTITAIRDDDGELTGFSKVTRDMTERRAYEQRLEEEKAFVESLFETQYDLVYAFDDEGTMLRWNDRITEVTGYTDTEIETMHPLDLVTDGAREEAAAAIGRVLTDGESVTAELLLETKDGEQIPYEFSGTPMVEDGEIVGLTGVGRDVSERRRRREQIERQRDELDAELRAVYERVDDAFFAVDEDWQFTHVNEAAAALLDRPAGDLVGQDIWAEFPAAVDSRFQVEYERAMDTQTQTTFEEYYPPLETWFEMTIYPSESGLSVYFRDITARKERERELEQYETVVGTVEDGIYAVDDTGRFVMVNEGFCALTGYDRAELLGAPASTVHDDGVSARAEEMTAEILAGERDAASIELDVETRSGESVRCEARFAPFPLEGGHGRCGVVRDITDRLARERQLQQRLTQQERVAQLGERALSALDLDALMAEAARLIAETLDTDYCKVLDLDAEADHLLLRQGVGWQAGIVGSATVSASEDDSQAAYTLATEQPVVVEDLTTETRFSGPALLTDHDVRSGISTVIGPQDDPWGILGTHDRASQEFSKHDVAFVQSVANILASAITRQEHERELVRQRERLAALNNLQDVAREITDAVIDQSTRAEIEQTVCDHIADSASYEFAWIGEVDVGSQEVLARAEAGVEDYLSDVTITTDPDDEHSQGPTGRAFRSGEIEVAREAATDDQYEPWQDRPAAYRYRSSAAIPIVHEETLYGVLNVYTARENAFAAEERAVVAQLGEIVGHAIAASDRKRALMSDEVIELSFVILSAAESLGIDAELSGPITIDHAVAIGDDDFLVYGSVAERAVDDLEAIADAVPQWESMTIREDQYEATLSGPPVLSAVAAVGGRVDSLIIEDDDIELTVHLSPGSDVRRVVDVVEEIYPGVQLQKRRQTTRTDEPADADGWRPDLTDRQRTALEVAYHAGLFEWPRAVSGEEVAESLDIAASTFNHHIRKAEQKVIEQYLSMV